MAKAMSKAMRESFEAKCIAVQHTIRKFELLGDLQFPAKRKDTQAKIKELQAIAKERKIRKPRLIKANRTPFFPSNVPNESGSQYPMPQKITYPILSEDERERMMIEKAEKIAVLREKAESIGLAIRAIYVGALGEQSLGHEESTLTAIKGIAILTDDERESVRDMYVRLYDIYAQMRGLKRIGYKTKNPMHMATHVVTHDYKIVENAIKREKARKENKREKELARMGFKTVSQQKAEAMQAKIAKAKHLAMLRETELHKATMQKKNQTRANKNSMGFFYAIQKLNTGEISVHKGKNNRISAFKSIKNALNAIGNGYLVPSLNTKGYYAFVAFVQNYANRGIILPDGLALVQSLSEPTQFPQNPVKLPKFA